MRTTGCAFGLLRRAIAAAIFLPLLAFAQSPGGTLLHGPEAAKLLPDAVFFAGRSAGTQLRNAAGVRFSDGKCALAVLVDTSGYSTGVQQEYQGYLLTEAPLEIGGHSLPAGAYGVGFVGSQFHVMDIGAHDLLAAPAAHDGQMQRPVPLQVTDGASPALYRLCFGRECVTFRRAH